MYKRQDSLPDGAVRLEIWSGNLALMAKLDAAPWLQEITQSDLDALILKGWGGRGREAVAVRYFQPRSVEVDHVVRYSDRAGTDVCFRVDAAAAVAWLRRHRPHCRIDGNVSVAGAGIDRRTAEIFTRRSGCATREQLLLSRGGARNEGLP